MCLYVWSLYIPYRIAKPHGLNNTAGEPLQVETHTCRAAAKQAPQKPWDSVHKSIDEQGSGFPKKGSLSPSAPQALEPVDSLAPGGTAS
jgi:hypothetical protein